MATVVGVFLMPVVIGFMVSFLMKEDAKEDKKRSRYFTVRKPTLILCFNHLNYRKPKQVALIDDSRCKICLARRSKK